MAAKQIGSGRARRAACAAPRCWPRRSSDDEAVELARVFTALGRPGSAAAAVPGRGGRTRCARCDLEEPLGKSQPTVCHHTKALADAGLITGEKRGRWVNCTVVPERLAAAACRPWR